MRPTVRLGTFSGIDIGLHWTVALVAVLFTVTLSGSLLPDAAPGFATGAYVMVAMSTALLFLGSVVAHELGHSVVARRNGVGIEGITLFALGGVAVMSSEPRRPGPAFRIAIAGPLVSVGVGAVALGAAFGAARLGLSDLSVVAIMWLGIVNLVLAGFNMLPALPLDGGRVLQAALWRRSGDRLRATVTAAGAGRLIGGALMLLGAYWVFTGGDGLWTAFIGWFIASSAKAEELLARSRIAEREWQRAHGVPSDESVIDV